jgi:hypothetical protein
MRRLSSAAICIALLVAVGVLSAHDDYRIVGTVTKLSAKSLDVKQAKDGKVIAMAMDNETIVTRDKKKVDRAELKVGANVVVDARGDSLKDLLVLEVRLVPAPTTKQ